MKMTHKAGLAELPYLSCKPQFPRCQRRQRLALERLLGNDDLAPANHLQHLGVQRRRREDEVVQEPLHLALPPLLLDLHILQQ